MERFLFFLLLSLAGVLSAQNRESLSPVGISKAKIFSSRDIWPLITSINPNSDSASYIVRSFSLSVSAIDTTSEGIKFVSFIEPSSCGNWTDNQKALIDQYGKKGAVFILENIIIANLGKPGTPFNPAKVLSFSVPDISFTIHDNY